MSLFSQLIPSIILREPLRFAYYHSVSIIIIVQLYGFILGVYGSTTTPVMPCVSFLSIHGLWLGVSIILVLSYPMLLANAQDERVLEHQVENNSTCMNI